MIYILLYWPFPDQSAEVPDYDAIIKMDKKENFMHTWDFIEVYLLHQSKISSAY